jgi:flagellar P-ring protein precursor FlgI
VAVDRVAVAMSTLRTCLWPRWGNVWLQPPLGPQARTRAFRVLAPAYLLLGFGLWIPVSAGGQEVSIGELTYVESDVPVRLMGYGLVTGLDGTGDRVLGDRQGSGFTVRSIANLLRRFDVEVPEGVLRTRNTAAVLVSAEVSPWLRAGGRFTVHVSSLGDATSLRGGVLWMTPLLLTPESAAVATAQGPVSVAGPSDERYFSRYRGGTSAQIPDGGIMELPFPSGLAGGEVRLFLREPDLQMADRIAAAINAAFGAEAARMEDPGSVLVASGAEGLSIAEIQQLQVESSRRPRILVDARDGTVVAGGNIRVGAAVVSREGITLAIQSTGAASAQGGVGSIRLEEGVSIQEVAAALHAIGASSREVIAIFLGLRDVGAIRAEVVAR